MGEERDHQSVAIIYGVRYLPLGIPCPVHEFYPERGKTRAGDAHFDAFL